MRVFEKKVFNNVKFYKKRNKRVNLFREYIETNKKKASFMCRNMNLLFRAL